MKLLSLLTLTLGTAFLFFASTAGPAMAEHPWNADRKITCAGPAFGGDGMRLRRGTIIQFPSAETAERYDVSGCNGPTIPADIDWELIDEIAPWLAEQGYTDVVFDVRRVCITPGGRRDPDGGCRVDDGISDSLTGARGRERLENTREDDGPESSLLNRRWN